MNKLQRVLIENLSAEVYNSLATRMGISEKRKTMILNAPSCMTYEELKQLSRIMKVPSVDLMMEYKCAQSTITIDEAKKYFKLEYELASV